MNDEGLEELIQFIKENINEIDSFAFIADFEDKHSVFVSLSDEGVKPMVEALQALRTDIIKEFIYN